MDEARVIPLHGDAPRRRAALRRRSDSGDASVYPFTGEAPAEVASTENSSIDGPSTEVAVAEPWEQRVAEALAFLRRRIAGEYPIDDFGFDADLTRSVLIPALSPLYDRWFRVEITGAEHIPTEGPALLVANHAGGLWAMDAAMEAIAVHRCTTESGTPRFLRLLGADLVFDTPGLSALARKAGATLACNPDAERLLRGGELVGVWPEGFKGIGKRFSQRYTLQRFGRGGFVHAALKTGAPIIPVSVVGSEEIHPVLGNVTVLARLLNLPYFPVTPTFPWLGPLGLVPLPSKWHIEFWEPIETAQHGPDAADDAVILFELTDQVRDTIQSTLYRLLVQRRSVWR